MHSHVLCKIAEWFDNLINFRPTTWPFWAEHDVSHNDQSISPNVSHEYLARWRTWRIWYLCWMFYSVNHLTCHKHMISFPSPRLLHSPKLVVLAVSEGYETWPPVGWHHSFVIGWSKYRLGYPSDPLHYGFMWSVRIPTIIHTPTTVPLPSPKGRQMPALRAVQGDCERVSLAPDSVDIISFTFLDLKLKFKWQQNKNACQEGTESYQFQWNGAVWSVFLWVQNMVIYISGTKDHVLLGFN